MLFLVSRWVDLCCYLILDWAVIRGAKILLSVNQSNKTNILYTYIYIYIYIEKMSFELCNNGGLRVERKF